MRRNSGTHITSAAIGAVLWAVALMLPRPPEAHAQLAVAHSHPSQPANPVAAEVRDMVVERPDIDHELECLALNVYWEARGEPLSGRLAVAAVTLNRVAHPAFPHSICQVVLQGVSYGRNRCQFSWACDTYGDRPRDPKAWAAAQEIAYAVLFEDEPDPTDGALYFHATRVSPNWSRTMVKVGRIGSHIYYRDALDASNEMFRPHS
jgi:N-acetylmuramoyl-L-alanine amidase